jgi:large subunit ribosomal protein L21
MYAIVDIAGQQFKVVKDQKVYVHRLDAEEGTDMEFAKVLLIDNEGKIQVGNPVVEGAKIAAKVLTHLRGDKVLVFKKKRRKGYQKLSGHRQNFTQIQIQDIILG